ncbi:Trehalose receptor [Mactra antiquata]
MFRNSRTSSKGSNHVSSDNDVGCTNTNDVTVELDVENKMESKDFSYAKIYEQLKPLLVCMRLFGLYFKRIRTRKGRPYMEPVVLYCFVVNFMLVLNVVRSFTVYRFADHFDNVMVQKLLFTIWSFECAFKGLLMMWNCFKQEGLPKFFCEWDSNFANLNLDKMCLFMMKKYIFLAFLFIIVNSVVFTLILIYVPVLEQIYLEVIWKDALTFGNQLVFKIVLGVLAVLNSSSSMFPVSLFVVLSFAIGKRLKKYTDELTLSIAQDDFHGRIEDFRLRHQNLCSLVNILDHVFAPMIAAVYSANIPMFCLVLYTMVTTIEIHVSLLLINLFWLCFIMLQMTIVSVTAAWVNVMAHSPLEHIYSIRFSNTSNEIQLQMMMFLNRLTGTQVGLSAMKLFVIDKPTILTVAGMMVTYFVLLIQFKMPIETDCQCNVTGHIFMGNQSLVISQIVAT